MDYEKYNNALEKAKARYNEIKDTNCSEEKFLLELFPELKESEDERIRKGIIDFLWKEKIFLQEAHSSVENNPKYRFVMDAIAWLEKQKAIDKEIVFRPSAGIDIITAARQALEKIEIGKEVVLAFNGAYIHVNGKTVAEICNEYFAWSEKQNKNNSENYCEDCINRKGCINCENGNLKETISLDSYEKQGEQDFSHNVEDEIRNELYDFIYITTFQPKDLKKKERFLAWLEKQGESYTKKDVDDAYLKGVTNTKNEIEKQYEANYQIRKDIATFIFNYRGDIKDRAKWMDYLGIKVSFVEKQDEKKVPINDFKAKNWYVSEVDGKIHDMTYNPADKVGSKFKDGDWITIKE